MSVPNGDDLLNVLASLSIDLRRLNPNVIRAWFDTDCPDTRKLLNWMTTSLSTKNYLSPLEKNEFEGIENKLDADQCAVELRKLNENYLSILDPSLYPEEILYIEDELDLLEHENEELNQLLKKYESKENHISLELTHKTQKEIASKVACKQLQKACEEICDKLDGSNKNLRNLLLYYSANLNFEQSVNDNFFNDDINALNLSLGPIVEMYRAMLEETEDWLSEQLEKFRKRIFRSQQKYIANKVEVETLEKVLDYLQQFNINDLSGSNSLENGADAIENSFRRKNLSDVLEEISSKVACSYVKQIQVQYIQRDIEKFIKISQNVSDLLENITLRYSYYVLTACVQLEEKKRVETINEIYKHTHHYVCEDLCMCAARTEQMKQVIAEYNSYIQKPICEKSTLISSIAKALSCDGSTLNTVADAIGQFKAELNALEMELFSVDMKTENKSIVILNNNIKVLKDFLMSGPTQEIILVPLELRKIWQIVEEHLKKQSKSVKEAAEIPGQMRKSMSHADKLKNQLWMNFLTNPDNVLSVLNQAEAAFNQRNEKYFSNT